MTLIADYRLTLAGELEAGAPNNLATRWGAMLWALRRCLLDATYRHHDKHPHLQCPACGLRYVHAADCAVAQ